MNISFNIIFIYLYNKKIMGKKVYKHFKDYMAFSFLIHRVILNIHTYDRE